jgi:hypothetical protein
MWSLITDYWHWGVVLMGLRTLPRLIWRIATAVPLLRWSEDKIEEMRELDQLKDRKIDFLEKRVVELEAQAGSTGSSSASPALTLISDATRTSSPPDNPSNGLPPSQTS